MRKHPLFSSHSQAYFHRDRAKSGWPPPANLTTLPLWPNGAPGAQPRIPPRSRYHHPQGSPGRRQASDPHQQRLRPTMTVYSPSGKNTGAAIVVFPGGGYRTLPSISKAPRSATGSAPRNHLRAAEVPCRPGTRPIWGNPESPSAAGCAALARMVRFHAAEWHIDPKESASWASPPAGIWSPPSASTSSASISPSMLPTK